MEKKKIIGYRCKVDYSNQLTKNKIYQLRPGKCLWSNEAFIDDRGRPNGWSIFNGEHFEPVYEELEPFYIFPINGFKFLYSKEVENSSQEYKQVFDVMYENFGSEKGNEIIIDLLKFTYSSDKLHEGISNGSEIIIFNIPFYYAIRANTIISYSALVEKIKNIDV